MPRHALSGIVADPNDDPIIDLAVSAQAPYLVTGDKKVLDVGEFRGVKILNSPRLLRALESAHDVMMRELPHSHSSFAAFSLTLTSSQHDRPADGIY
jgi:hypothetical protein